MHAPLFHFRVSMPEESLCFNAKEAMDLAWIERWPVFHLIACHMCDQNADFIQYKTAEGL